MNFEISEQLAQTLLNYLITKPYVEVFQLIQQIQALQKISTEKDGQNGN